VPEGGFDRQALGLGDGILQRRHRGGRLERRRHRALEGFGKGARGDRLAVGGERGGAQDLVIELADVAGEGVGRERPQGVGAKAGELLMALGGGARQEHMGDERDVVAAFAERW